MKAFEIGGKAFVKSLYNTKKMHGISDDMEVGDIITILDINGSIYCTQGRFWHPDDLSHPTKLQLIYGLERELAQLKKTATFFWWEVEDSGKDLTFYCSGQSPLSGETYSRSLLSRILFDLDRLNPETTVKTLIDELSKFVDVGDDLPF